MKTSHFLLRIMVLFVTTTLLFGNLTTTVLAEEDTSTQTPTVENITVDTTVTTEITQEQTPETPSIEVDAAVTETPSVSTPEVTTPTITLEATKVICDTDDASPHWGNGTTITATTASEYVAHSDGHCHLAPNWNFQWSDQTTNPQDIAPDAIGEASGFTTFGPTDANGSATVTIPFPSTTTQFHVREVMQTGYIPFTFNESTRDNSNSDSAEFYCETDGLNYDNFEYIRNPIAGQTYHCVAFNVPTTPVTPPADTQTPEIPPITVSDSGSGTVSGGGFAGGGGSARPQGQVLGASTTCGEYITDYIKLGSKNDSTNVSNLQTFLNMFLGKSLKIDGIYGIQTFNAVKDFQVKQSDDVLLPWKKVGYNPNLVGTGYVYKTTKREINNIMCPSLNLPLPLVP